MHPPGCIDKNGRSEADYDPYSIRIIACSLSANFSVTVYSIKNWPEPANELRF